MMQSIAQADDQQIAVVVLNYNGYDLISRCMDSLVAQKNINFSVIFVDNGSIDNSIDLVGKAYPLVHVVANKANLYFAAGNNVGIRLALEKHFKYVFVLNNDTEVAEDCLWRLHAFMEGHERVGACQPVLCYMHRPDIVASAGCLVCISGKGSDLGCGQPVEAFAGRGARDVVGVTGGAMFLRAEALREVGLFDETFQMYLEDVDLSLRLREAGWSLFLVPEARVLHEVSATVNREGNWKNVYFCERNSYKVILKNYPPGQIVRAYALSLPSALIAACSGLLRGKYLHGYGILKAMAEGMVHLCCMLPRRLRGDGARTYPFWPRVLPTCYPPPCLRPEALPTKPE